MKPERTQSPLARVRKPEGRVDLLIARLLEEGVKRSNKPLLAEAYREVRPLVEDVLHRKLGPRTRRGRKLASDLFALRELWQSVQRQRRRV